MDKIHVAAAEGLKEELVNLSAVQNLSDEDDLGFAPIHHAAINGHAECVSYLLSTGIDASKRSLQRHTPLQYAACNGHVDVMNVLLNAGANVNEVDHDGWGALHHAAFQGQAKGVEFLLSRGATVDLKNQIFCTPLHVACMSGHKDCMALLLTAGAEHEYDPPYVNPVDSMNRPPPPTSFDEGVIFQRSALGESLLGLLQSGDASDEVLVSSDNVEVKVHKCVLAARCPRLLEKREEDRLTSGELEALLFFVYSGWIGGVLMQGTVAGEEELNKDVTSFVNLVSAARKLDMNDIARVAMRSVVLRIGKSEVPADENYNPDLELLARIVPHANLFDEDFYTLLGFFVHGNFSPLVRYYTQRNMAGHMSVPKGDFIRAIVDVLPVDKTVKKVIARPSQWRHGGVAPMQPEHKQLVSVIVSTIRTDKLASWFEFPVSSIDYENPSNTKSTISDYWAIVIYPMHLEAVSNRLESNYYVSPEECINDLRLCFCNALRYNDQHSNIYEHAQALYYLTGSLYKTHFGEATMNYAPPLTIGNIDAWVDVEDEGIMQRIQKAFATGHAADYTVDPLNVKPKKGKAKSKGSKRNRKELKESDWKPLPVGATPPVQRKKAAPKKAKPEPAGAPSAMDYAPPPAMEVPSLPVSTVTFEERQALGQAIQGLRPDQIMPLFQILQSRGNDGLAFDAEGEAELDLNGMTDATVLEIRKYVQQCQ